MPGYGKNKGRYSIGYNNVPHLGKVVPTTVGNKAYSSFSINLAKAPVEVGYIPAGYEHRPDLISNLFYGTPANWWLILEANNIDDPFEGLNVNDRIVLPGV